MLKYGAFSRVPVPRGRLRPLIVVVAFAALAGACGDGSSASDPVTRAQSKVTSAQADLDVAKNQLATAGQAFCGATKDYLTAIDRYGKLFTDSATTVGDVKAAGVDLAAPKGAVSRSATAVTDAQTQVGKAEQELAQAQVTLTNAQATASSVPATATTPPPSTTTTALPPPTVDRVKQAESDFQKATAGVTDTTPLTQASVTLNSAAFALQVSWLRLFADAGCLTDDQQAQAATQVTQYSAALQSQLQAAGYYQGEIDGIYGPVTVAAVQTLQTETGLPATGLVDKATALALDKKVAASGHGTTPVSPVDSQTAALQTVLTLTGYWTGPIDGIWTDQLTGALKAFQNALGVEPTGVVDVATLAAFEEGLAQAKSSATTSTTAASSATSSTASPTTTTTAPTTSTTKATTTTT